LAEINVYGFGTLAENNFIRFRSRRTLAEIQARLGWTLTDIL